MKFICLTLLIISGITDSRSEQYKVVGPADSVFAVAGEDVILPCSVKPSISVVDMRVEWHRLDQKYLLVHLFDDHEDRNTEQIQSYRGRTKLNHQELQRGNASLKLSSVRVSDEGLYKCFIQSKSWNDDTTVNVKVEAVGRPPVITVDGFDHSGGLHLQCESEGWYPEPDLEWLDSAGVSLSSETTETHRNTEGFNVKHTITVHHSDKIHCRVKLRHHMLEALIISSSNMFNSWRTSVIVIVVLSVIAGILIAVFAHKNRVKPSISVVDMRVEWHRLDQKYLLVHLFDDHEDRNTEQIQSYRGRTKLNHQELQRGNASLKLSSVRVSDEGLYKCFIQSKSWNDDTTVNVKVEAVGRPPVITVDGFDHSGGLHLQCESEGWYPEPDLEWLDSAGVSLSSETTEKHRNTEGFNVKHTITLHHSDKIHCRVKLRHHMLEALIITTSNMFISWRTPIILISVFIVLSMIAGILIAVFVHKNKVNVILDADMAHSHLIVSDDGKQVRNGNRKQKGVDEQKDRFDQYLGVLGKDGFSSGCFYFEVQVKGQTEWYLGVTRASVSRTGSICLSPENGYWSVCLKNGKYWAYESYHVSLSLSVKPQRVGVFVDYEKGLITFYDVESMSLMYSYTNQSFDEKLYPFDSLGYLKNENFTPLIICDDY
ncbi:butyrophilin-like protein 3 [Sinocyclocheilus rhinocerous]|uniref:butyrophilin-like protein 3 n=1 Tax=Sinocyclocheilus rhinocerous TaxID=307959 RepID=UPI0007B8B547|nr:PREDICTED: butyrophilin-like protein 3 [Sinocyclocheilus rhinocerous]